MQTVKRVMTANPVAVTLLDNIYEIAVLMKKHDTGFVPVVESLDNFRLIGVVTDRDLVLRGYADKHSGSTAVETVMTKNVVSVAENASVDEAAELMRRHQIRRLPVTRDGKLLGIVSLGDLAVSPPFAEEAGAALRGISDHVH